MNTQFEITYNVPVEHPPVAAQVGNAILGHVQAISSRLLHEAGSMAMEVLNVWDLAVKDQTYGTDMLQQYKQKQRDGKLAGIALQYGLTPRDAAGKYIGV